MDIQKWMKLIIQFLDGKHLHPKLDDIDHPEWMTLMIQIRMKVTVVNNTQNWMTVNFHN